MQRFERSSTASCGRGRHLIALALVVAMLWATGGRAESAVRLTGAVLLAVDYDNEYFRKTRITLPDVHVVHVEDRRGGHPEALGSIRSEENKAAVPLVLADSVAVFIQRAFEIMLGAAGSAAGGVHIALGIEQFEIVHTKDPRCARLDARLAVTRLDNAGPTELGWIQVAECEGWFLSPEGARAKALYRGTAALAQGLSHADLGLDTSAVTAVNPSGTAGRPTVTSVYVSPTRPVSLAGAYVGYLGFAPGSMQDAFDGFLWVGGESRIWLYGGSGFSMAAGLLGGNGRVETLQPDLQYDSAEVRMLAAAFEASYLHRLRRSLIASTWFPYVGIGGDWYIGSEKINVKVTDGSSWFEAEESTWRTSVAAHAVAGTEFALSRRAVVLLEARWTQGGNGWSSHATAEPGSPMEMADQIFHFLVRPTDFNFSGWGARVLLNLRI